MDHPKIQIETAPEAASLLFYSPSHHLMPHPSHSAISLIAARHCSHSAPRAHFSWPGVWRGISATSCKAEIINHIHTQQSFKKIKSHSNNLTKYLKENNFKILKVILMETDVMVKENKQTFSFH